MHVNSPFARLVNANGGATVIPRRAYMFLRRSSSSVRVSQTIRVALAAIYRACGISTVRPNWKEQPTQQSLTEKVWR